MSVGIDVEKGLMQEVDRLALKLRDVCQYHSSRPYPISFTFTWTETYLH
jgi:hypothetical protein